MTRPDPSDLMDIDKVAYALPVKRSARYIALDLIGGRRFNLIDAAFFSAISNFLNGGHYAIACLLVFVGFSLSALAEACLARAAMKLGGR